MTTVASFEPDELQDLEESYIPRTLQKSVEFLAKSREQRAAWPLMAGLPSNLRSSALVIAALRCVDKERFGVEIADAALYVRGQWGSLQSPDDLIDLLTVAIAEHSEARYITQLFARLDKSIRAARESVEGCPTVALSRAALAAADGGDRRLLQEWCDALVDRQRTETGSWPDLAIAKNESLAATAWALRALVRSGLDKYAENTRKGLSYLLGYINEHGWDEIAAQGSYVHSIVVQALSVETPEALTAQDGGVLLLARAMNPDGGWGVAKDEVSGTEYTALAIRALFEAGIGRYVPCRAVEKVLLKIRTRADALELERDRMRENLEDRVREECGRVIQERRQLRQEMDDLKSRLDRLEQKLRDQRRQNVALRRFRDRVLSGDAVSEYAEAMEVAAADRSSRFGVLTRYVALAALVLGATSLFMFDRSATSGATGQTVAASIAAALTGIALALTTWAFISRRRRAAGGAVERLIAQRLGLELADDSPSPLTAVSEQVELFRFATADLPPDVREEIIYRLASEGSHMPSELAHRFTMDLLMRLHIPPRQTARLERWLEAFVKLTIDERRTVLLQLRRYVL
ncbi:hypothetical protein [Couchioplanes azureus]|uniref:hypothetical protein n=1 Tax=Couchioplanes caeruleus TaxID=56438 RepID=UPI00166FD7BC|nr:hypothetical protein [Couchioplanes caeruleus]GGQ61359.1 hypothetical protein GCM10010166_33830 [Couchioplanes caeruleus subsp. azureus]